MCLHSYTGKSPDTEGRKPKAAPTTNISLGAGTTQTPSIIQSHYTSSPTGACPPPTIGNQPGCTAPAMFSLQSQKDLVVAQRDAALFQLQLSRESMDMSRFLPMQHKHLQGYPPYPPHQHPHMVHGTLPTAVPSTKSSHAPVSMS